MHKRLPHSCILLLALLLSTLGCAPTTPKDLGAGDVDYRSILSAPPATGSPRQQQEIQILLDWQAKRTPEDVARCRAEAVADEFYFGKVLGPWFDAQALPQTAAFFKAATAQANVIKDAAKDDFKRTRPFVSDPRIQPCVKLETSHSYPSGHAMRGIFWATLLAQMFPEHRDELMAAGKQYGDDRVVGGVHYPSDVQAGQKLGAAIAEKLLKNPPFRKDLARAKEECLASAAH